MFNNAEINRQLIKIQKLIEDTKLLEADDELRSHLAKYICILCSGFIENSIYHIFTDIAERSSPNTVAFSYSKSQLFKVQNANSNKIREITKAFNQSWHDPLKEYMQDNDRAAAINYILTDRHNIAHGRDSVITIGQLEAYLIKSIEVIKYLEINLI